MKKFNLFVMSLLATASFTLNSCSTDDAMSSTSQQQSVDGFYMTLQVKGSTEGTSTRTEQNNPEKGTTAESDINSGTIYLYEENGTTPVFTKTITASDWSTAPKQDKTTETNTEGVTNLIKVSVNKVKTGTKYNVYFLANNTTVANPLSATETFTSTTGGATECAQNNAFVMFNQNDKSKQATHSTVTFTDAAKSESTPATAETIYLDRVVARIDAPTVSATKIESSKEKGTTTENISDYNIGIEYQSYAVSNLNNNSYVMQNWTENNTILNTLYVADTDSKAAYYKNYAYYGNQYEAKNITGWTKTGSTYAFENSTNEVNKATALYFCIKANLTTSESKDFSDGTFYRYDHRLYTSIAAIIADTKVDNPFGKKTADEVVKMIKGEDGALITDEAKLAKFREDYHIEVYRAGLMYYRWAIEDNYYSRTNYYSVLRNSIYKLDAESIYDIGKDVPNGPDPEDNRANYYMKVKVSINPWVLNTTKIQLK